MRRVWSSDPGRKGDLVVRGAHTFAGYVQGARFTERCCTADGWLNTGDRARRDADGYVRITGRSKDMNIRRGENVRVKKIEDVVLSHPKVGNGALAGVPHERRARGAVWSARRRALPQRTDPYVWVRLVACASFLKKGQGPVP